MAAADDFTKGLIRQLRSDGKLASENGAIDDETAEALLKTPPVRDLQLMDGSIGKGGGYQAVQAYSVADAESVPIAEIVARIEKDCGRFHPNLTASMRLASEQMHRSLLQLFEDVVRDKVVDLIAKKIQLSSVIAARGSSQHQSPTRLTGELSSPSFSATSQKVLMPTFNGVGSGVNAVVSRRPYDKGLEKRDRALTAFVLPDQLREELSNDINLIVENELRRCVGTIGTDVDRIFKTIQEAKGRMSRIEEDILQRQVEGRMQAEQLVAQDEQIRALTEQITLLEEHQVSKDSQMDVLRDQVLRRNQTLDESRVRFRREILRYKQRLFELETDLEAHVNAKSRRRTSTAILHDINVLGSPPPHSEDELGIQEELTAAAEMAVKECTERLEELHRRREVQLQREKKAIQTEMALRLSERDAEIIRLKEKIAATSSH